MRGFFMYSVACIVFLVSCQDKPSGEPLLPGMKVTRKQFEEAKKDTLQKYVEAKMKMFEASFAIENKDIPLEVYTKAKMEFEVKGNKVVDILYKVTEEAYKEGSYFYIKDEAVRQDVIVYMANKIEFSVDLGVIPTGEMLCSWLLQGKNEKEKK